MKTFTLSLTTNTDEGRLIIDKVEADDIVQLLSQFNTVIAVLLRRLKDEEISRIRRSDDDIPF
jgi:hypothetical protein